jgi:hypothetical protein
VEEIQSTHLRQLLHDVRSGQQHRSVG